MSIFLLLISIQISHFVCDFLLQMDPYLYKNKGTWLHAGGLIHAFIHACGFAIVLFFWGWPEHGFILALANGCIHYLIDYSKVNLCKQMNLTPTNSEWYWVLLGLDQLFHQLTYLVLLNELIS